MKFLPHNFAGMMVAILATGALLNLANRGTFGAAVKDLSNFITSGYGAGTLN